LDNVVSVYEQIAEEQHGKAVDELPWGTRVKGKDLMALISTKSVIEQLDRVLGRLKNKKTSSE
ncbi:ADP-heptose--LPS heptosyltransferase I, partial [Vibrio sp. 10N.222.55.C6]